MNLNSLSEYDNSLLDSCLTHYHAVENDTAKLDAIVVLAEQSENDELWLKYNYWVHAFAVNKLKLELDRNTELFYKDRLSNAISNIGFHHAELGESKEAINYFERSLVLDQELGNQWGVANTLINMGAMHSHQGNSVRALECFHQSLLINEELEDLRGISFCLTHIGLIHKKQRSYEEALSFYYRALEIDRGLNDYEAQANALSNLGSISIEQEKYDEAMEFFNESLELCQSSGDKKGIAIAFIKIGEVFAKKEDVQNALNYHYQGLALFDSLNEPNGIIASLCTIGSLELKQNNIAQAEKTIKRAYHLADQGQNPANLSAAAKQMWMLSKQKKDYKNALKFHEMFITTRDSLNSVKNQKEIMRQEFRFEYEQQKVLDDSKNEQLITLEKEETEKQQIISYGVGIVVVLLGVLMVFVFNRLKITRKQKGLIESAHKELEEKNNEIMDSIVYAKRIQSAILPPNKIVKEHLKDSFILYKPKAIVAGDFYWLEHKNGKVLFAAADCTGHGVPGAMVSVVCNNALNRTVREHGITDPGKILNKTREIVVEEFEKSDHKVKDGMDIALCSLEGNQLQYAGAHNPLWIIRNGEIIETKADKQPIGKFDNAKPYTTHNFGLETGDAIYLFSDGYVDQFGGEKGKKFKAKAFRALLLSIQEKSMEEQKIVIDNAFESWKGSLEQIDDVCVIGVRI